MSSFFSCCSDYCQKSSAEHRTLTARRMTEQDLSKIKNEGRLQGAAATVGSCLCCGSAAAVAATHFGSAPLAALKTQTYIAAGSSGVAGLVGCGLAFFAQSALDCISDRCSSSDATTVSRNNPSIQVGGDVTHSWSCCNINCCTSRR